MDIPAGWYPDDSTPGVDRYWDGTWWTAQTRDSAKGGLTPPPSPPAPTVASADAPSRKTPSSGKSLLAMTSDEFQDTIAELADREHTYPVLIQIHASEAETCQRARLILENHKNKAGRAVIRPQIQDFVAWQKHQSMPTIGRLGAAMQRDFDDLVVMLGGPMFIPGSMDQAWDNFTAPIRLISEAFTAETMPLLSAVASIEDDYLFV